MFVLLFIFIGAPRMLDERGAGSECSALMPETAELLVGRQEGIYLLDE